MCACGVRAFVYDFVYISAAASGKSYKEQKEMERRARAGDSVGWNASFVRSDTVVDALADRLGVGKSDILDREEVRTYHSIAEYPPSPLPPISGGV